MRRRRRRSGEACGLCLRTESRLASRISAQANKSHLESGRADREPRGWGSCRGSSASAHSPTSRPCLPKKATAGVETACDPPAHTKAGGHTLVTAATHICIAPRRAKVSLVHATSMETSRSLRICIRHILILVLSLEVSHPRVSLLLNGAKPGVAETRESELPTHSSHDRRQHI